MRRTILRTYPHLAELANFHLRIAEEIDNRLPHWLGYAEIGRYKKDVFLQLVIPAPMGNRYLMLYTQNHRMTIGFCVEHGQRRGLWHCHYDIYRGNYTEPVAATLKLAKSIMNEERIVYARLSKSTASRNRRKKSTFAGYGLTSPVHLLSMPEMNAGLLLYTMSWRGSFDRLYHTQIPPRLPD